MNALARLIGGWKFMQNGLKIKEVKLWDPMKRSVIKHKSPWKLCSLHVAAALCHATEKDRTHRLTREREREKERETRVNLARRRAHPPFISKINERGRFQSIQILFPDAGIWIAVTFARRWWDEVDIDLNHHHHHRGTDERLSVEWKIKANHLRFLSTNVKNCSVVRGRVRGKSTV